MDEMHLQDIGKNKALDVWPEHLERWTGPQLRWEGHGGFSFGQVSLRPLSDM